MKSNKKNQAGNLPAFKNPFLLQQAFIHRSYLNEQKKFSESNERLEYLGDAVLELITSERLYTRHPHLPEGKLTNLRSKIVQTSTLAWAAKALKIDQKIYMSKGERSAKGNQNPSILADTLEAVIGAIYLDQGYRVAQKFIINNLIEPFFIHIDSVLPKDYKSELQEIIQAKKLPTPEYRLLEEKGPDHNKTFKIAVLVKEKQLAIGVGKSKQKAEQEAAKQALEKKVKNL